MGNGTSKEEQLYQAVQNGNHNTVKALRRDGASLEFIDKEGRTPLVLACTRGDLFEMVLTLLDLGANIKTYRPGTHGGYPLHHAAKRGLDKTVLLLLSRGADPLAVNDDSLTPLDMARARGHVAVVRMIEDRICLFSGVLRELSGPGFLEALAPQWVTKKIWAVVLPTETDPRRTPKFELVIYQSPKVSLWNGGVSSPSSHAAGFCNVPLPRTIIALAKAEVEEPKFSSPDPVLVITDRNTKTKYKFLADSEGDRVQLERLYKACKGIAQNAPRASGPGVPPQAVLQGLSALVRPTVQQQQLPASSPELPSTSSTTAHGPSRKPKNAAAATDSPDDVALKMAINASLRTASQEGIPVEDQNEQHDASHLGGWGDQETPSKFNGWSSASEAGPSRVSETSGHSNKVPESVPEVVSATSTVSAATSSYPSPPPSAPPLPADLIAPLVGGYGDPIHYPSVDTSPVKVDYPATSSPGGISTSKTKAPEEKESQCVVCWDAPAQGVCIPCGHLAGCMDCLSEIKAKDWGCPVCRAAIQQVIRVYAV